MVRHLILSNSRHKSIDLFTDYGIRLVGVEGLGFGGEIITSKMYAADGELYQSTNLQRRAVTINLRYRGAVWTHEQSKKRITDMLANKEQVRIRYVTDITDVYIDGYIENIDTPQNAKPLRTQISIICPDPYFIRNDSGQTVISGTEKMWEFPLEIPEKDSMIFGDISSTIYATVINEGAVAVGGRFEFVAKTKCRFPKLTDVKTGAHMGVDIEMQTGDRLIFVTHNNGKAITFISADGTEKDVFNLKPHDMKWLKLETGKNIFRYTFEEGDLQACDITVYFDTRIAAI